MLSDVTDTIFINKDHLKLIKRMSITYDPDTEFGAPEVNPKCPYGNSDVFTDMREILEAPHIMNLPQHRKQEELFLRIHEEMTKVLQILVQHLSITAGKYIQKDYDTWEKVDEPEAVQ